ncbi:MAG: hypothetical protein SVG88_06250 [Halobacteriales archaeon]|nr:hypothetical protein [Halobacteriales archaeon]
MDTERRRAETFADKLGALKRSGCNVLVLHGPGETGRIREDLMGDPSERRRRLFVTTIGGAIEGTASAAQSSAIIDATPTDTRSTASAATGSTVADLDVTPRTRLEDDSDLSELARLIDQEINGFDAVADGLESGELRVCIDRLEPLVERTDEEALFQFLHLVTTRIRDANGMGHFHAAADAEESLITTIAPLFEICVHVRTTANGVLQQRWRLRDADIDTGWLQMDAV